MRIADDVLREMVRDALARHGFDEDAEVTQPGGQDFRYHASHRRLPVASGSDGDGACLIEPGVSCSHCGYCQSVGH